MIHHFFARFHSAWVQGEHHAMHPRYVKAYNFTLPFLLHWWDFPSCTHSWQLFICQLRICTITTLSSGCVPLFSLVCSCLMMTSCSCILFSAADSLVRMSCITLLLTMPSSSSGALALAGLHGNTASDNNTANQAAYEVNRHISIISNSYTSTFYYFGS